MCDSLQFKSSTRKDNRMVLEMVVNAPRLTGPLLIIYFRPHFRNNVEAARIPVHSPALDEIRHLQKVFIEQAGNNFRVQGLGFRTCRKFSSSKQVTMVHTSC